MGIDARMILKVQGTPTKDQLLKWGWALNAAMPLGTLWVDKESGRGAITLAHSYDDLGERVYTGLVYQQDGEDIHAGPGETLLEVHLCGRYYGEGYERGDILAYCAVAEWCEANIPGAEVWYGGDSSGVCAEPFGEEQRQRLRKHLYSASGRAYFRHFSADEDFPTPELCSLCAFGKNGFIRYGWGNDYVAVSCHGCNESFTSRDGGKTWVKEDKLV